MICQSGMDKIIVLWQNELRNYFYTYSENAGYCVPKLRRKKASKMKGKNFFEKI